MKKASSEKTRSLKLRMTWQTGDFHRFPDLSFPLPYQFLLLCRLTDVTPLQVVRDFTRALDGGYYVHPVNEQAKEHAINYFISRGYGQQHYTPEELHLLFKEMQAVKLLFPANADADMQELYVKWRDAHYNWWFNKWFNKSRRNPDGKAFTR